MDSSTDAMLATQTSRCGTGKGIVNPPNILRSSRSMEHRSPSDAQLRLFPSFKDENECLQTLQEEQATERRGSAYRDPPSPPPMEKKNVALQYATQISGRDLLADLHHRERRQAERNHIIMLVD